MFQPLVGMCFALWLGPAAPPVPVVAALPQNGTVPAVGEPVALAQRSKRRRRRDTKPKQRPDSYEVVEVRNGGTIEGVVRYEGTLPKPRKIQVVKDQETCDLRDKLVPRIRVNDQQQVAEAVVILADIGKGKAIEVPAEKPVIDQTHCTFSPHITVVTKDQPFEIVNSDPVAHSAHITQNRRTLYNRVQPQKGMRSEISIAYPGLAELKCDVHDWMKAYIYVLWHPYYDVTAADGAFRLTDVPPGEYELVVWQEVLGEKIVTVRVEPDKTTKVDVVLTRD